MLEWYFPWNHLDLVLRTQVVIWMLVVLVSYWITWRSIFRGRPWFKKRIDQDDD